MKRKIKEKILDFLQTESDSKALLITGARQIGKTYIIRECLKEQFSSVIEINFIENENAKKIFSDFKDTKDILFRLSAIAEQPLIKGETVFFLDEVQESKELVTAIKFLVEEGSFRYVLSGSLLGVELKDIRSIPVGYLQIMEMYPMDFEEFCVANQVGTHIIETLRECFEKGRPIDGLVHEKMLELFRLYLIIGGMPAVVQKYIDTNNLQHVTEIQKQIIAQYKKDIAKYDPENKLYLEDIFNLIPSELNNKNKRFIMKKLNENFKFSRYENSFVWLKDAGVALPVHCAAEPVLPLLLSKATNLFKLFLSDVGLLAAMYANGLQMKILMNELNMNYGAIYENVVAQELKCHGFELYYYNNNKQGELDFLIEYEGKVLPIEIKSGKDYERHAALNNCLMNPRYDIEKAFVFCNENVQRKDKIHYYPIYMISFLHKEKQIENPIYKPDFSILM
ncbi:MAG: ATP-binding protein [Lachnospiraceae bacterium]|nr:ATP-binding protein [Lachnospiraceae bacterium]